MRRVVMTESSRTVRQASRNVLRRRLRNRRETARPESASQQIVTAEMVCSFGATRVGMLLERVRLHLGTQRFLAARRGDQLWEIACDYGGLAVERLGARMRPERFAEELPPAAHFALASRAMRIAPSLKSRATILAIQGSLRGRR